MSQVYLPSKNGGIAKIDFNKMTIRSKKKPLKLDEKRKSEQSLDITSDMNLSKISVRNSYIPLSEDYPYPIYSESILIVKEIINQIIIKSRKKIHQNKIEKELPRYAARNCIWLSEQLANGYKYPQDNQQHWKSWSEDKEPQKQKLDSRQVQRIPVSKQSKKFRNTENDDITGQLEILLAQPKLYFKLPENYDKVKGFFGVNTKKVRPQSPKSRPQTGGGSSNDRNITEKDQKIGNSSEKSLNHNKSLQDIHQEREQYKKTIEERTNQDPYSITYKIKKPNGKIIQFKAPINTRMMSPRSTRSTTNTSTQSTQQQQQSEKNRLYVRKIINREATIRNINENLQQFKEYGEGEQKYPYQKIEQRSHQKYLKELQTDDFKNVQPLNLKKNIRVPSPVRLIDVPRQVIEMDFKADVRSMSPYHKKRDVLNEMNYDLFLKKDQDEFRRKVQELAKKKHLHINYLKQDDEKPAKKPKSPGLLKDIERTRVYSTLEEKHDTIQDLLQGNPVKLNQLPLLNINRHKFPPKKI